MHTTSVIIMIVFFWVVTSCNSVIGCRCFGGTYCLHLQGLSEELTSFLKVEAVYISKMSTSVQKDYTNHLQDHNHKYVEFFSC
jgi:hypothetical protein